MGYLCADFSLPRPLCSRLRPDVRDIRQTDRQTSDVRQHHRLMPPPIRVVGTISRQREWIDPRLCIIHRHGEGNDFGWSTVAMRDMTVALGYGIIQLAILRASANVTVLVFNRSDCNGERQLTGRLH